MVNGDVWCNLDFSTIPRTLPRGDLATLYLVPKPDWRERGDFSISQSRVVETDSQFLYAGIAICHPNILEDAKVEKFSIVPASKMQFRNLIGGILFDGEWDDVGTPNA